MNPLMLALAPGAAAAGAALLLRRWKKGFYGYHPLHLLLLWVLPFAGGGFHGMVNGIVCVLLALFLVRTAGRSGGLNLYLNWSAVGVASVALGFLVTPVWAADRGMALFGTGRGLALLLAMAALMQLPREENRRGLELLPITGAVMTGCGIVLLCVPGTADWVSVNGRLSGFLQYPNTFAVLLLAGLAWNGTKSSQSPVDLLVEMMLMLGVVLSGSRTAFVLLLFLVAVMLIRNREWRRRGWLMAAFVVALGGAAVLSWLGLLTGGDRLNTISLSSGTFLARLLYFRDALGLIASHPFGLGYWGYRAVQGAVQTGRYAVTFVHNGLLQLLLDVGWIPAGLIAAALLRVCLRKGTDSRNRLMLLVVLGHCMLDFDLQFLCIWMILLLGMELHAGTSRSVRIGWKPLTVLCGVMAAVCLWLGTGEALYQLGSVDGCLTVTPFHTEALEYTLTELEEPEELESTALRILDWKPSSSIAHSAMANVCLSRGDVAGMIENKQLAIASSRYTVGEYCDYIAKLYAVYGMYVQAQDHASAEYCAKLLGEVPEMLQQVEESTSELAWLTGEDPSMKLPVEYEQLLAYFASAES